MQSACAQKIGLYGGAFDPPHLAHHALAQAAIEQFGLQWLIVLPTGQAWHKSRNLSAAEHRIAMARLAFADLPQACIDPRETLRSGATYTIDTLRELSQENPSAKFYLLMGQDQLQRFHTWHQYADILQLATLLVADRAHSTGDFALFNIEKSIKIPYRTIHMPLQSTSATEIRQRVQSGAAVNSLVQADVAAYIAQYCLYSS